MWTNKRYGKGEFSSRYERDKAGDRVFVLTSVKPTSITEDSATYRRITFESWQAAKKLGWIKK